MLLDQITASTGWRQASNQFALVSTYEPTVWE